MRLTQVLLGLVAISVTGSQATHGAEPSQAARQASAVTVPPRPTPAIPEGHTGIAAKYPGDVGIEKDPDVVFVESFEGSVDEICSHWEAASGKPIMSPSNDVPPGSGGKQSLLLTRVAGGTEGYMDGGNLYRRLKNEHGRFGYDQLFFRCYMKFNQAHAPIHHYGSGLIGFYRPTPWPQGGAGERPQGDARWTTQVEPGDFTSWNFYTYWHEMGGSPPRGQTWGNTFEGGVPARTVAKEQWLCLEIMVKLNDIGDSNGEQAYWLDGKLSRDRNGRITSYLGKGFPAVGTWTYDKFQPYATGRGIAWDYQQGKGVPIEGGRPFPGFSWRKTPELNINAVWLYRYMSRPEQGTSKVWWDHVVVAKKYIGPLTGDSMLRHATLLVSAILGLAIAVPSATTAGTESPLRRVEVAEPNARAEVTCDIAELIAAGRLSPRDAVSPAGQCRGGWILRTPQSPPAFRWPRNLLNAAPEAPPLVIDLQLTGTYDVHALVRAVDGGGTVTATSLPGDPLPMAFELALDDFSQREIVGAKGFRDRHFDCEVLAGCGWSLTGRKLVVRSLGKPVYLYGFRLVPCGSNEPAATHKATRWLATDHVTVVQEPDKHFAFPGAARLPDGDLVVVYREGTVHETEAIGKVSLSRSSDGGRTWQPRATALDRPEYDDRDPSLFQMSDGTLALFSNDCVCTSRDGGRTWSVPRPTPVFGPKGGVEDEQGRLLYGGLQRVVQADVTRIAGAAALLQADAVYRSPDKGLTWQPAGIATYTLYVPGRSDYVWYDEPFLCVVPGRFWICAARVDLDGFARIIRSPDRGRTWEPVRKTPVWGFPQHLLPLRDGRLLMTYGYRRPPFGVRACLSSDCGQTWDLANEVILRMDGGTPPGQTRKVVDGDLGYPTSLQLADGTIFTVYYHNTAGSNCFIAGTFWKLPEIPP